MTRDIFEAKIIQERVIEAEQQEHENFVKRKYSYDQNIINNSLSWYYNMFREYEDSLKESNSSLSYLGFRRFLRSSKKLTPELDPVVVELIKEKYIACALYDVSYEYLDSDESYDASEEMLDPLLVMGNYHK